MKKKLQESKYGSRTSKLKKNKAAILATYLMKISFMSTNTEEIICHFRELVKAYMYYFFL